MEKSDYEPIRISVFESEIPSQGGSYSTWNSEARSNEIRHPNVQARRSGSSTHLMKNDKGEIQIVRKDTDLVIAAKRRISQSTLPSILPSTSVSTAPPLLDATDALERTGRNILFMILLLHITILFYL
jgi:hypothetical protein